MKKNKTRTAGLTAASTRLGIETLAFPFLMLLLVAPVFYFQVTTDETFKVSTEFVGVVLGWVFVAISVGVRAFAGRIPFLGGRGSKARLALAAFLGWAAIMSSFGYHPASSWGYLLTVIAYLIVAQSLVDWVELRPLHRTLTLAALGTLVSLQVVISLLQFLRVPMLGWGQATPIFSVGDRLLPGGDGLRDFLIAIGTPAREGMVTGTLGNINYLAELVALTGPVLILWGLGAKEKWQRQAVATLGAVVLLILVITGARAALLGTLIAGAAVGIKALGARRLHPRHWWNKPKAKLFTALGAVTLLLVFTIPGAPGTRLVGKLSSGYDGAAESRVVNWKSTVDLWAERPLTGAGIGSYKLLSTAKLAETHPTGVPQSVASQRFLQAHSDPLQLLAELGLVGLALALGALIFWIRETWTNPSLSPRLRAGLVWGVGALVIASFFGFPFHIPLTSLAFMVLLALGIARDRPDEVQDVPETWRPALAAVLVGLIALAGWQAVAKGVGPLYQAHRYEYVGEKLKKAQNFAAAEQVFALASRHNRFKGSINWQLLQMKVVNGKPDEALALFEASAKEGLGMDAWYWKGRAHQIKGQHAEAIAAYEKLVKYYDPSNDNYKRAMAQIQIVQAEMAKASTR